MKQYKIVVSFGDGLPKETTVFAKNGIEAHDVGFKTYPAARSIHVFGSISNAALPSDNLKAKSHLLYGYELTPAPAKKVGESGTTYVPLDQITDKEGIIAQAVKMREAGLSYSAIGKQFGMYRATIRRWILSAS